MKQIMIDTNIFDKLIQDSFFPDIWDALEAKLLCFITTQVQEEEINNIYDHRRKRLLQGIPRKVIPLSNNTITKGDKHTNDRLIAKTAVEYCDFLVSEDRPLQEWYHSHYPDHLIFNYQEFLTWFLKDIHPLLHKN